MGRIAEALKKAEQQRREKSAETEPFSGEAAQHTAESGCTMFLCSLHRDFHGLCRGILYLLASDFNWLKCQLPMLSCQIEIAPS